MKTMKRPAMDMLQAGKNERKKKSKRGVQEAKEVDGKKTLNGGGEEVVGFTNLENLLGWEEWPWLRGVVDEQMSWGSVWLPSWDVDFVDKAYAALFSDVAWDDDIWNLKTIMEIPKP